MSSPDPSTSTAAVPGPVPGLARVADRGRGPSILAGVLVVLTVLLIGLGGMVTSTGSGMAFRDWPLANGSLWPGNMELAGLLEHSHRVLAALVGLLVLTLTVWVGAREKRTWLRRLTVVALGLVVCQGIIGGVGVLENLPVASSTAHGFLAQVTLGTLVTIAFALSAAWQLRAPCASGVARTGRRLCSAAVALILTQILVGALARHGGTAQALWTHALFSLVVAIGVLVASSYCSGRLGEIPGVRGNSRWVLGVLLVQMVLGFAALAVRTGKDPGNIAFLGRSALITSHVVVGAVLLLLTVALTARVFRNPEVRAAQASGGADRP